MTPKERRTEGARQNAIMNAIADQNREQVEKAISTESYRLLAEVEATVPSAPSASPPWASFHGRPHCSPAAPNYLS